MPGFLASAPARFSNTTRPDRSTNRCRVMGLQPRHNRATRLLVIIIVACAVGPGVVGSTPPARPPFHEFHARGTLRRGDGGSLANFTVVFVRGVGAEFYPILGSEPDLHPIAVTDATGEFFVSVRLREKPEQLALATLVPGGSFKMGEPFSPDVVIPNEIKETHVRERTACQTHMETEYTAGYRYTLHDQMLDVE